MHRSRQMFRDEEFKQFKTELHGTFDGTPPANLTATERIMKTALVGTRQIIINLEEEKEHLINKLATIQSELNANLHNENDLYISYGQWKRLNSPNEETSEDTSSEKDS